MSNSNTYIFILLPKEHLLKGSYVLCVFNVKNTFKHKQKNPKLNRFKNTMRVGDSMLVAELFKTICNVQ